MSSFTIACPEHFSFRQCLHFLQRSPLELLHTVQDEEVWSVIRVKEKPILFSVKEGLQNQLVVQVWNQRITVLSEQAISHFVTAWFDLKTHLAPFYSMASRDALLKPLVKRYAGYRIVGIPDLFESLSWAIIGQQINLPFAYRLKQQFVHSFGDQLTWNDKTYYQYPEPSVVANLDAAELLRLQFSRQKADYVIATAKTIVSGAISEESLAGMSFEEAKECLVKLRGIGNWTANYVLMKTFHHPNAFPLEDAGLHQAIRNQLSLPAKPSCREVEQLFKKYEGWEAYATVYLWRSLSA